MESQEPSTNASSDDTFERVYQTPSMVKVINVLTEHYIVMFNVSRGITEKKLNNNFPIKIISIQTSVCSFIVIRDNNSLPIIYNPDVGDRVPINIFHPNIVLPAKAQITIEINIYDTLRIVGERVAIIN